VLNEPPGEYVRKDEIRRIDFLKNCSLNIKLKGIGGGALQGVEAAVYRE